MRLRVRVRLKTLAGACLAPVLFFNTFWLAGQDFFSDPESFWLAGDPGEAYFPGASFLILRREPDQPLLPSLRPEADHDEELSWEEFLEKHYRPLKFDLKTFVQARAEIEERETPVSSFEAREKEITERLALPLALEPEPDAPRPKPPELEIPSWEGKVAIAGRKLISLSYQTKKFLNPAHPLRPRATPKPIFDLRQELQLRISGNVSDRVVINVDYDDTKENKRDISIVYRGAPGETVREISFGDITLNLPQTQFTSYSKQLFGIKGEFDFKRARLMAVGSQTKGQFAVKRFSGQNQFESGDIKDTDYIRRTFYDLAFSSAHLPLQAGSVVIYRDDRNPNNDSNAQDINAEDFVVAASTYQGKMDTLVAGVDYVVDHQKGILRFLQSQAVNSVMAVDYTAAGGTRLSSLAGTGKPKILKTDNDLAIADAANEVGYRRESKTFYSFKRTKIMRDDGKGSFILKLLEKGSRKDVSSDLGIVYPNNIEVDFEQGIFRLTKAIPDSEVYLPSPISKYVFAYEIRFVLKTYILQPNLVLQSEKVYQDGRLLTRDLDYFIDYDSGFLTFLRPETITPETQIEVTYEVAPFGSRLTETLIGARGEGDLLKDVNIGDKFRFSRLTVGSSVLLQQAAKPATIPDIRSLPTSYSIYEGDAHLYDLRLPGMPFTTNLHTEIARSVRNPNTFKKALIESMEGIKIEDASGLDPLFWFPLPNADATSNKFGALSLSAGSERVKNINPNADVGDGDTQPVLNISYDLGTSTAASAGYLFSPIGLDFSNKEFLELTLISDTTGSDAPEISFTLGRVNEDADADGVLDKEDVNSDGGLNFGEDVGWNYNNPDGSIIKIGAANGRLDGEDIDRNGRLDPEDPSVGGTFGLVAGSTSSAVNFTTWLTTAVPLGVTTSNQAQWVSVKTLRVTVRRKPGGKSSGVIRIARMAAVGTRWERPVTSLSTGTVLVTPINNIDDVGYAPLFAAGGEVAQVFDDLYGGNDQPGGVPRSTQGRREQSLRIRFDGFAASSTSAPGVVTTQLSFPRAVDLQSHKILSFFFNGPASTLPAGTSFFLRVGSANDYWEYQLPIGAGNVSRTWYLLKIKLDDLNKDGKVDTVFAVNRQELNPVVTVKGIPNLGSVPQMVAGISVPAGAAAITGDVWLDDIFMQEPREKKGTAKYYAQDFSVPRWANFGFSYKSYNQDFESPGQAIINQGLTQRTANLSFSRFAFMPFNARGMREILLTPSVIQTGASNLVSQLSEGRVEKESAGADGSLDLPVLPPVSWSTSKSRVDNKSIQRIDDTEAHSGSFSMGSPLGLRFIQSWSNSAGRSTTKVFFSKADRLKGSDNLAEFSETYNTSMALSFFKTRFSLNPSYRLSTVREKRTILNQDDTQTIQHYPKARAQDSGLSTTVKIFKWLEPNASFTSSIQENHRVESPSFTITGVNQTFLRGQLKSINRQASTSFSQNLDFSRLFPDFNPTRSFTHYINYQTTDGDSYENVLKDFKAADKLWVRKQLKPTNAGARRTNLTLRDAISINSRWSPFVAVWPQSPFATLSISHNYSKSLDRTETTGTSRKSLSLSFPDLTVSMSALERLLGAQRWMSSTSLTSRFSKRLQSNINIDKKVDINLGSDLHFLVWQKYDLTTSYSEGKSKTFNLVTKVKTSDALSRNMSLQVGFNWGVWRLTNKMGYATNKAIDGLGKLTADQKTISPSASVRGDFSLPAGLALPFSSKRLTFTNRMIITSGLGLERRTSSLNVEQTNTDDWNWNLNGDFEIGRNLRAGMGSTFNLFKNRVLKDQDFYTYAINAQIVFQF
ncbi:MAG: hypothetical protein HY401_03775 [Elusimicrobia bacterium]|nr:hypothetical protein [Elusimicrobiota bacterium]